MIVNVLGMCGLHAQPLPSAGEEPFSKSAPKIFNHLPDEQKLTTHFGKDWQFLKIPTLKKKHLEVSQTLLILKMLACESYSRQPLWINQSCNAKENQTRSY